MITREWNFAKSHRNSCGERKLTLLADCFPDRFEMEMKKMLLSFPFFLAVDYVWVLCLSHLLLKMIAALRLRRWTCNRQTDTKVKEHIADGMWVAFKPAFLSNERGRSEGKVKRPDTGREKAFSFLWAIYCIILSSPPIRCLFWSLWFSENVEVK